MPEKMTPKITFPGDRQVLITAQFDVPADALFRSFTTPELVTQWWGRPNGELTTCEIDLRPGGTWRYVFTPVDGPAAHFHGTYQEVRPGQRVSYNDVLEDLGGVEAHNTVTFDEVDGRTTLRILAEHSSTENRDRQAATLDEQALPPAFDLLERVAQSVLGH